MDSNAPTEEHDLSKLKLSSGSSSYERKIFRLALFGGLPAVAVAIVLLIHDNYSGKVQWTVGAIIVVTWLVVAAIVRERVVRPLQTLSNLLGALREGDYSIRARGADREDALGLAFLEANVLGETLRTQRLGAMEASTLLRTVMAEIDVAVYAFDERQRLRLVNRAGARVLDQPQERLLGRTADQLGLAEPLGGETPRAMDMTLPGARGRWEVRRQIFRQDGKPHTLLVLADLSKTLREEELKAWQRLVRVLSHEINNSLAPIKSLAGSLQAILDRQPRAPDADDDLQRGLTVIAGRAEALVRFMSSYARLARLPTPQLAPVDVDSWVRRIAALETRLSVQIRGGPRVTIRADGDQLDQLLINLVRNAVDASLQTHGGVSLSWARHNGTLEVQVVDDGPGVTSGANLFVPFFTTKPEGSGIGLVLSRQIAEAHGGSIALENRHDAPGCVATVRLPVE
ncbi:MAG TPA: ATP-binding protein [Gemmatimonadaceae bacterium]|nr:ATP-binding protein [Gemmatimonadaceae bacterium]